MQTVFVVSTLNNEGFSHLPTAVFSDPAKAVECAIMLCESQPATSDCSMDGNLRIWTVGKTLAEAVVCEVELE